MSGGAWARGCSRMWRGRLLRQHATQLDPRARNGRRVRGLARRRARVDVWPLGTFGREVALDDPPRLEYRNYASGGDWPEAPSAALDHRAGGPKEAWELGRLTSSPRWRSQPPLGRRGATRARGALALMNSRAPQSARPRSQHANDRGGDPRGHDELDARVLGEQAWMEGRDAPMGLLAQQALWRVSSRTPRLERPELLTTRRRPLRWLAVAARQLVKQLDQQI